jgi:hypothetical protein
MTYLMRDDVNDEVPNGTPKTLILFDKGGKLGWGIEVRRQAIP